MAGSFTISVVALQEQAADRGRGQELLDSPIRHHPREKAEAASLLRRAARLLLRQSGPGTCWPALDRAAVARTERSVSTALGKWGVNLEHDPGDLESAHEWKGKGAVGLCRFRPSPGRPFSSLPSSLLPVS
ncbi:hypothetical protein PVAP13_9KG191785 [Panicum virgatum]|uniref:Uncharacterized protein n=1 Tax=Panicum virgatum TaxID=38727 RepID=A0A8T0NNZ3_PANVG|nr:hypothetical protein PVAP13_9KG191785 [Panicum virgatum]